MDFIYYGLIIQLKKLAKMANYQTVSTAPTISVAPTALG